MKTTKPSIVFCHGIWADGSSFSKVIPPLQADGYEVMAAQYGLDTPEGDVATVKQTLGRVSSPAIRHVGPLGASSRLRATQLSLPGLVRLHRSKLSGVALLQLCALSVKYGEVLS